MRRSKAKKRNQKEKRQTLKRRFLFWVLKFVIFLFLFSLSPVILYRYVDPPTTPLMWIRWAETEGFQPSPVVIENWVPIEDISDNLIKAVISAEDSKFFNHAGFDWDAVGDAFWHNLSSTRKIGASTISMQTARNTFLWQSRTWLRKILEAYYTVLIEAFWGKARILEVYLNIIEWGEGVFGCSQASQLYFSQSAKSLSAESSAWLASVLPNPRAWPKNPNSKRILKSKMRILKGMKVVRIPSSVLETVAK
jgi:monofunctional biosynthetic peptidoglycan transglycosylase